MSQLVRGCLSILVLGTVCCSQVWADEQEAIKQGVVRVRAQVDGKVREGTGFIVKSRNDIVFIVTAAHVIEGDPSPRVEFYAGKSRTLPARIVGIEAGDAQGLAVLAVEGEIPAHTTLLLNQEKQIKDGDRVTVVGFPRTLGVPWAVTEGTIMSRKGKKLLLSGPVEEGNSGGPLFKDGEVIGVLVSKTAGYFYAVPALIAKYTLESWRVGFGITLRATPVVLSPEGVDQMVRERHFNHPADLSKDGLVPSLFLGDVAHEFERLTIGDHPMVIDRTTGLMWQQQGSVAMPEPVVDIYVEDLNRNRYAGFSDWRVPTLEEAASLIHKEGINNRLFIDQAFDPNQQTLWTSDQIVSTTDWSQKQDDRHWYVDFRMGGIIPMDRTRKQEWKRSTHFVRAVRTVRTGIEPPVHPGTDTREVLGTGAHPPQPSLPAQITGTDGALMRLIPAGPFLMGAEDGVMKDAGPAHTVSLDSYYLDQYEVTRNQYAKFLQTNQWPEPYAWREFSEELDPNVPVTGVDWLDAVAYCHWARKRLPTEAEWEKAARGTDGRHYPWGNDAQPNIVTDAWTTQHSGHGSGSKRRALWNQSGGSDHRALFIKWLHSVGSFPLDKSPFGIFDLAGNVAEWVSDWYGDDYYSRSSDRNPIGPTTNGPYRNKVVRGGSWADSIKEYKETTLPSDTVGQTFYRDSLDAERSGNILGFRCAQDAR